MQINKTVNYAIGDLLQFFIPHLTLLNEMIYATATVKSPVAIMHKQNSLSNPNGN